jgi:translation initiation factor IF-1
LTEPVKLGGGNKLQASGLRGQSKKGVRERGRIRGRMKKRKFRII